MGQQLTVTLEPRAERGADTFPLIPLALAGTKLGVLGALFRTDAAAWPEGEGKTFTELT